MLLKEKNKSYYVALENSVEVFYKYRAVDNQGNSYMDKFHFHDHYEIIFIKSGGIEYEIGNKIYTLGVGDIAIIPPYVMHFNRPTQPFEKYVINFRRLNFEKHFSQPICAPIIQSLSHVLYSPTTSSVIDFKDMCKILAILGNQVSDGVSSDESMTYFYLGMFLGLIPKYSSPMAPSKETRPEKKASIKIILEYINQEHTFITSLDQLSKQFFISKPHLTRIFKKETGFTIMQYVNKLKIETAINLLLNSNLSVTNIGEACGFDSSSYFSKVFKTRVGCSPENYRKKVLSSQKQG